MTTTSTDLTALHTMRHRLTIKAVNVARQLRDGEITGRQSTLVASARLDSLADVAADVLGMGIAPFGYRMAVGEAVRDAGPFPMPTSASGERGAWVEAVIVDVFARLDVAHVRTCVQCGVVDECRCGYSPCLFDGKLCDDHQH